MDASAPSSIRVLLVDDQLLLRESLGRLLDAEPGIEVAAKCSTVSEALDIVQSREIDVVILDLDLGHERAHPFVRCARERGFRGRILVLADYSGENDAVDLIRSGVSGIFLKQNSPESLVQALRKVAAGESWLDGPYVSALIRATAGMAGARPQERFTEREKHVLRFVVDGLANKQIGDRLSVSESSVKSSLQQLFRKTGVRTRAQLVRVALERHLDP